MQNFRSNYLRPSHPSFFSGLNKLKTIYPQVKQEKQQDELNAIEAYTRHKESKPVSRYNPLVVTVRLELLQLDLLDVKQLSEYNDGINHILMIIDTFSRKAWGKPLPNKKAVVVVKAFEDFLERDISAEDKASIERVLTDKGKEFTNRAFKNLLLRYGIKLTHPNLHAPHVERLNRSIQKMIYAYLTQFKTRRYIDNLDNVFKSYNTRIHSTHKMTPNEAFQKENAYAVNYALTSAYENKLQPFGRKPKFKVGDFVRVKTRTIAIFARSYKPTHEQELFQIRNIVNSKLPEPMYQLKGLQGEEIEGKFYGNQLAKVKPNEDMFRIEKVVAKRKRRGIDEVLIKWEGYGERYNTWLSEEQAERLL